MNTQFTHTVGPFTNPINREAQDSQEQAIAGDRTVIEAGVIFDTYNNYIMPQANAMMSEMNALAVSTVQAAQAAQWSGNFKGNWSDLSGALDAGDSVHHNAVLWMALTDIAVISTSEPKLANTDWLRLSNDPLVWDDSRPFEATEKMTFTDGVDYTCLADTAGGESPLTTPTKWRSHDPDTFAVYDHGSVSGTLTVNIHQGGVQKATIIGNTAISVTGYADGYDKPVKLLLTDSGGNTLTWDSSIKHPFGATPYFEPDSLSMFMLGSVDGGTTITCNLVGGGYA